jgi:hypothetical protein
MTSPQSSPFLYQLQVSKLGRFCQRDRGEDLFALEPPPLSYTKGEQVFRRILCTASKHNIILGYRKNFAPGLPNSAKFLISECDELRARDPTDPTIPDLNARIIYIFLIKSVKLNDLNPRSVIEC